MSQPIPYELLEQERGGDWFDLWLARRKGASAPLVRLYLPHEGNPRATQALLGSLAQLCASPHPNLERVLEVADAFAACEHVSGLSLVRWLADEALAAPTACWIAARLADAAHHVHQLPRLSDLPRVTQAVRPGSVRVTAGGDVRLLGAGEGEARVFSLFFSGVPTQFAPPTSFNYLSREETLGAVPDHRSEVASLGAVLWHLLSGRLPHRAQSTAEVADLVRRQTLDPLRSLDPGIPEALSELVRRTTAPKPADRPETAASLRDELVTLLRSHWPHYTAADFSAEVGEALRRLSAQEPV